MTLSAGIQFAIAGLAAYSYTDNRDAAEWSMFALSLTCGFVNPKTYEAVGKAQQQEQRTAAVQEKEKEKDENVAPQKSKTAKKAKI